MSPLSNNTNNNTNSSSSLASISSANNIHNHNNNNTTTSHTSSSAFKPLVSENRQLNMLSSSLTSATANPVDPYGSDLSAYGSAYHHHHHHLNAQLSTPDYLNVHHQSLPLGVYKGDHDDLQSGYSFARPVKLYEHNTSTTSSSAATACVGNVLCPKIPILMLNIVIGVNENEENTEI